MIPWYVFTTYWLIAWLRVKRTKVQESRSDRLATIIPIPMVIAFELLFSSELRFGLLGHRFIPAEAWVPQAGIALTTLGVALAIWARYCLGQYWSARVTLREGHRIIRSGPYAFVRHPIYTGMLLAAAGTALVIGERRGVLGVLVMLAAHTHKALREQALLTLELGEEYSSYRRATGFLFPCLWRAAAIDTHAERS